MARVPGQRAPSNGRRVISTQHRVLLLGSLDPTSTTSIRCISLPFSSLCLRSVLHHFWSKLQQSLPINVRQGSWRAPPIHFPQCLLNWGPKTQNCYIPPLLIKPSSSSTLSMNKACKVPQHPPNPLGSSQHWPPHTQGPSHPLPLQSPNTPDGFTPLCLSLPLLSSMITPHRVSLFNTRLSSSSRVPWTSPQALSGCDPDFVPAPCLCRILPHHRNPRCTFSYMPDSPYRP